MGAKLAAQDKLVVHFLGDTALGMCGMGLETAARERIPTLSVLVKNGLMGGYEKHIPLADERYRSGYLSGDSAKVAERLGVAVARVTGPSQVVPAESGKASRRSTACAPGCTPGTSALRTEPDPS
jgi:acetolactate synthase-1/2/3 large subunit